MNTLIKKTTIMAILLIANFAILAQTQHGWRGPNRNGTYNETNLLKSWAADVPQLIWENLEIGKGYSSPVVAHDKIFVTGMNEDETQEIFTCFTLAGKKVYSVVYGKPFDKTYPETRTTPTIVGDKAFVISGSGEIVCLNIANGAIVWKVDGGVEFERAIGKWGTSESPLVFDNKVIYSPAGEKTTMVCLNSTDGKVVWKTRALGSHSTYISPLLIKYNGKSQIVGATGNDVYGVNPETGNIDWTYSDYGNPEKDKKFENIATNTPLYENGCLFFSNGYDAPSFKLKLKSDLLGVELAWKNVDFDTHHGGFVKVGNAIYGSNWINNTSGNWIAVDWETGKTLFNEAWGDKGKGSIIYADGMLYCYDERKGTVGLVCPNKEKFEVVSEFRITKGEGPHWAHPVINDGVLYIRHGSALLAYKIKN